MYQVGSAHADITPPIGLSLSGFAARQDQPAIAIADPLRVKALALTAEAENILCLSFDLLGLDAALDRHLRQELRAGLGAEWSESRLLLTTTHTHSAPPTLPIAGETRVPESYIQTLCVATLAAARQAVESRREAALFHAAAGLRGIHYNRRRPQFPNAPDHLFPLDHTCDLWVFKNSAGAAQAAIVRLSCHAVTRRSRHVSADYPGELTRRLEMLLGAPVLFLQGTAGDSDPTSMDQDHAGMLRFVDRILAQLEHLPAVLAPLPAAPLAWQAARMTLAYAPFPDRATILQRIARCERILQGDRTSADLQADLQEYAGWRLPDNPDLSGTIGHWAGVYAQAAQITLRAIDNPEEFPGVPFEMQALQLGPFTLLFLSGEILTTLGQQIEQRFARRRIKVISYLSPVAGYLGTQADFSLGGYEPGSSSMWYRQPGPFHPESDRQILAQLDGLL